MFEEVVFLLQLSLKVSMKTKQVNPLESSNMRCFSVTCVH